MKIIDIRSPEGNVFCILGFAKSFQEQLREEGINNENLDFVLSNSFDLEYDEILNGLERTKLFKFIGRET